MSGTQNDGGVGHNQTIAAERLRFYFDRLRRLDDEIAELGQDKSNVRQQAKGEGFDIKIINMVMQRMRQGRDTVAETDALIALYEGALKGMEGVIHDQHD